MIKMNNNYINITKNLGITSNLIHISQPLEYFIHVFKHHDSIKRIKLVNTRDYEQFEFSKIAKPVVKKKFLTYHLKNLLQKVTYQPNS